MFKNKKILKNKLLILSTLSGVAFFLFFGFYHLSKFDTSDEHLWRDARVPAYWQGIQNGFQNGDWNKTYINDKPGVSLALISGMGLPFVEQPNQQYLMEREKKNNKRYKIYDTSIIGHNNFVLRLPLLLFTGLLILPLLVYLVFRVVKSEEISFWFALFLGLNPILIGISQILNPDAILWSSVAVALLSFVVFLQNKDGQRKFVWLAGIFTGMALLSKYTGNLLFLFYLLFGAVYFLYSKKMEANKYWRKFLQGYLGVTIIAWIVFALFLPAVLQSPDLLSWSKPKHFAYGTYFSPALKPILKPLLVLLIVLLVDTFYFKSYLMKYLRRIFYKYRFWLIRLTGFVLVVFFSFILINAWSGAKFLPLNDLKEIVGSTKKLHFDFLANDFVGISYFKQLSLEGLNFVFALPELIVFLLIPFWFLMLLKPRKILYPALSVFISWLPFIFFLGGLKAKVFVNVRYSIILFPFFLVLGAIAFVNLMKYFKIKKRFRRWVFVDGMLVILVVLFQVILLLNIRPYYFNYQNMFLSKEYVLADSWGYGIFEAATKLNSLPEAENLVVWSDRGAFCYYFVGHCVKNRRMDRSKIIPDFFVVTRRNVARKRFFDWRNDSGKFAKHPSIYYYQGDVFEKPWWELDIDGRKKNYIKIIKADER